jgi:hypothetical protein
MTANPQMPSEPVIERLVRIETKLDVANDTHTGHEHRSDAIHLDHETRIRRLERSVWLAAGAAAAIGGGAGALLAPLIGGQ